MRNLILRLAFVLVAAVTLLSPLHAQSPAPAPSATPTIKLTMEDQHVLKENLLKDAASDGSAGGATLERGSKVPASVQLRKFPEEIGSKIAQIKSHEYFIADRSIVIVEPQQRTIAEIVK